MDKHATKYIFVTGGVLSGVGKGITAASIGAVCKAKGLSVSIQKCDPYLNVDAGLLNPAEHGECFVTRDGAETDLDLGHYERFLDIELTQANATLSGRLLRELISDERAGKFGGKTVQLVPHLTNAIQRSIVEAGKGKDIHIVEIGGTVGDYEGLSFVEAIREFAMHVGRENCLYVHVVYVPFIQTSKEFKSKPAQNALNDLRGFGIVPDVIAVRSEEPAPDTIRKKLSMFGGVPEDNIILFPNLDTVYRIPLAVANSPLMKLIDDFTGSVTKPDLSMWKKLIQSSNTEYKTTVKVGLIAKYMDNDDTYISVTEAVKAASWAKQCNVEVVWVDAEKVHEKQLKKLDAMIVPGGFGDRGIEGKIQAAEYALNHNIPYLGICLGLQVAVIAAARKGGLKDAYSEEFSPSGQHVVYLMNGQEGKQSTGGTMRLGNYAAVLEPKSLAHRVYKNGQTIERHRHRYEVNQRYLADIERGGIIVSGKSPDGKLVEYVEAPDCSYFIATQAHPEFKSRPFAPHPLFVELIDAAMQK